MLQYKVVLLDGSLIGSHFGVDRREEGTPFVPIPTYLLPQDAQFPRPTRFDGTDYLKEASKARKRVD